MKNNLVSWEQIIISGESPIMEMHFAQLSRDKIIDTINATAHPGARAQAGTAKVQDTGGDMSTIAWICRTVTHSIFFLSACEKDV